MGFISLHVNWRILVVMTAKEKKNEILPFILCTFSLQFQKSKILKIDEIFSIFFKNSNFIHEKISLKIFMHIHFPPPSSFYFMTSQYQEIHNRLYIDMLF